MLRTTALTSYGSIVATDLSSRASSDARGGVEAVDGVGSLMLFLPANGFVAPAGIARHAAPGNAGADADRHRAAKPESGRPQARLHPRGADVAKAVDYRVDDILCLVAAALVNHRETYFPARSGDGVLRHAAHHLHPLDRDQRRR